MAQANDTEITPVLLNIAETCKFLNISQATYFRIAANGKLGPLPIKLCSKNLYSKNELECWVNSGAQHRKLWQSIKSQKVRSA